MANLFFAELAPHSHRHNFRVAVHPLAVESPPPLLKFTASLVNIHYGGLCCPSVTHGLALLSHYFKSITFVCSVIFPLQRRCMG